MLLRSVASRPAVYKFTDSHKVCSSWHPQNDCIVVCARPLGRMRRLGASHMQAPDHVLAVGLRPFSHPSDKSPWHHGLHIGRQCYKFHVAPACRLKVLWPCLSLGVALCLPEATHLCKAWDAGASPPLSEPCFLHANTGRFSEPSTGVTLWKQMYRKVSRLWLVAGACWIRSGETNSCLVQLKLLLGPLMCLAWDT